MSDDLTRIHDIGSIREKWINAQGICTYIELANTDPNWLYQKLNTENKPVSFDKVQAWIDAAKTLISNSHNSHLNAEDDWEEFASFYISYQYNRQVQQPTRTQIVYRTYADHIEANDNQQWEGIEGENLCEWIMNHVKTIVKDKQSYMLNAQQENNFPVAKTDSIYVKITTITIEDSLGKTTEIFAGKPSHSVVYGHSHLRFNFNTESNLSYYTNQNKPLSGKLVLYISEIPHATLIMPPLETDLQFNNQHLNQAIIGPIELRPGLYQIRAVVRLTEKICAFSVIDIPLLQII